MQSRTTSEGIHPRRLRPMLVRGVMICVAAVLFWSGVEHLKNPFAFLSSVIRYQLLTGLPASVVAAFLPVFQTLLAGMIVLGVARRMTSLCAAVLLTLFTAVQLSALLRGLEIGCGCFGAASNAPITGYSVSRVAALAALAWLMFRLDVDDAAPGQLPNLNVDECSKAAGRIEMPELEACP